jgi:hypothetical protein
MNGDEILREIRIQLAKDEINPDVAMRLILANQVTVNGHLKDIQATMKSSEESTDNRFDELIEKVRAIELYQTYYPSIMWIWSNKKRYLITGLFAFMLLYTFLFGWVDVIVVRNSILGILGLGPVP